MEKTEKDIKCVRKDKLESVEPSKTDRYQEIAEEVAYVIKDDLFDSTGFDGKRIADVLRRRFDINNEETGRLLMSEVTMFNVNSGNTFTIPMFGILALVGLDTMPIVSGKLYPNYGIRNGYIGYTDDGAFHRVNRYTEFVNSVKRNPSLVLVSVIVAYAMIYTLLNI